MKLREFRRLIESTAEPFKKITFVDNDEKGYACRSDFVTGETVERKKTFKKFVVVSLKPSTSGVSMERESFLGYLRSLEGRYSKDHHIVLVLYEDDPEHVLNYLNGERLMTPLEYRTGTIDGYRELLGNLLWGQVLYKGGNDYFVTEGGAIVDTASNFSSWGNSGGG